MSEGQVVQIPTGKSEAGNETVKAVVSTKTAEATIKTNDQLSSSDAAALRRAAEAARKIKQQGGGGD